jgi:hypothetical protein
MRDSQGLNKDFQGRMRDFQGLNIPHPPLRGTLTRRERAPHARSPIESRFLQAS